jgi:hypothetical protein
VHKAALEQYFGQVLTAAGLEAPQERAKELFMLIEGAMALILIHGDPSYAKSAANAAKRLFDVQTPRSVSPTRQAAPSPA